MICLPNAGVQLRGRAAGVMNAAGALRALVSCNDSLGGMTDGRRLRPPPPNAPAGEQRHQQKIAQDRDAADREQDAEDDHTLPPRRRAPIARPDQTDAEEAHTQADGKEPSCARYRRLSSGHGGRVERRHVGRTRQCGRGRTLGGRLTKQGSAARRPHLPYSWTPTAGRRGCSNPC